MFSLRRSLRDTVKPQRCAYPSPPFFIHTALDLILKVETPSSVSQGMGEEAGPEISTRLG